jgi:hypothetical protein
MRRLVGVMRRDMTRGLMLGGIELRRLACATGQRESDRERMVGHV